MDQASHSALATAAVCVSYSPSKLGSYQLAPTSRRQCTHSRFASVLLGIGGQYRRYKIPAVQSVVVCIYRDYNFDQYRKWYRRPFVGRFLSGRGNRNFGGNVLHSMKLQCVNLDYAFVIPLFYQVQLTYAETCAPGFASFSQNRHQQMGKNQNCKTARIPISGNSWIFVRAEWKRIRCGFV